MDVNEKGDDTKRDTIILDNKSKLLQIIKGEDVGRDKTARSV